MYRILFFFLLIFFSIFQQWNISVSAAPASISTFRELGIELRENIADTYYVWDAILIRGRVTDGRQYALIYIKNTRTDESISELAETTTTGEFQLPISLPKSDWEYSLIIASGNSFNTTIHHTIRLVGNRAIAIPSVSIGIRPIFVPTPSPYLSVGPDIWASMTIQQGTKVTKSQGKILSLDGLPLQYGPARVSLQGYRLTSPSSLDRLTSTGVSWTGSVYIDRTRDMIGRDVVSLKILRSVATMQFRIPQWKKVKSEYLITTPSWDVIEYHFPKAYIAIDGYLRTGILIRQSFQIPDTWVYKVETVQNNGYAYFNLPISRSPYWSIKETMSESQKTTLRTDNILVTKSVLSSINTLRQWLGRSTITIDTTLANLAERKAMDMARYNYVGHTTHAGLDIIAFADSQGIDITGTIGENVAWGNVSDISLQDGLEESGSHRMNMLDPDWWHVGIGYVLKNGRTYLVQIFGE